MGRRRRGRGPGGVRRSRGVRAGGARTLLLEATGTLGGVGTSGLVTTWAPFSDGTGNVIYGGLAKRLLPQTKEAMPHVPEAKLDWVTFNPEHLKRLYDELVVSSGAHVLFNAMLCAAETDGHGAVTSVIVATKSGPRDVRQVDTRTLREQLRRHGAYLPDVA